MREWGNVFHPPSSSFLLKNHKKGDGGRFFVPHKLFSGREISRFTSPFAIQHNGPQKAPSSFKPPNGLCRVKFIYNEKVLKLGRSDTIIY
jgi:hypothetical protein